MLKLRDINVGLAGKKHRCRLIVGWELPTGGSAYQVQTVDKPPASLWVMDLSARVFGLRDPLELNHSSATVPNVAAARFVDGLRRIKSCWPRLPYNWPVIY